MCMDIQYVWNTLTHNFDRYEPCYICPRSGTVVYMRLIANHIRLHLQNVRTYRKASLVVASKWEKFDGFPNSKYVYTVCFVTKGCND